MTQAPESERLGQVLLRGQRSVLQMLSSSKPQREILTKLCTIVEEVCPGTLCSILLTTNDGRNLKHAAGPSLPEGYCHIIDGISIGPNIGSCGTSAYRRALVIVTDIANDPLWHGYESLALPYGLASCASMPICAGSDGRVLGTFAIYHREAGPYSDKEIEILHSVSDLAAIVILNGAREQALRNAEGRVRRALEVSGVMDAAVGLNGRWLRAPQALCSFLDRSKDELLSLRLEDVIHPRDLEHDHAEYQRLVIGERDSFRTETRLTRKDGSHVWATLDCALVRSDSGKPEELELNIVDVTRRKHAEETLRSSQRMENFGLLAPGLAHDFNNLLTAILCNASLAQDAVGSESRVGEAVQTIETIARRAADLIRQTLAYAATGHLARRAVDLNQVVKETVQILSTSFLRNSKVELNLERVQPILGDASQLHQVVMNLVINAAQAIGDASGNICLQTRNVELKRDELAQHLSVQGLVPGAYVALEVIDNGPGIRKDVKERILEPFFTTKVSGRGVGLAVSLGILREHRAGLEIDSEVGKGSTFRVYLPASQAAELRPAARRAELYWPDVHGKVLVLDDDSLIRNAIVHMLKGAGFNAIEVDTGRDALLELVKQRQEIALVVFDLSNPRSGAKDALPIVRERWPELPVILTSGQEEAEPDADNVVLLRKPYSLVDLKHAMFGAATIS